MASSRHDPLASASSSEGEEEDARQSLTPSSGVQGSSRRTRSTATDAEGGGDEGGAAPLVKASTKRVDKTRGAYTPLTSTGDDAPSSRRSSRRSRQAGGEGAYASEKPNVPQQDYPSAEAYSDEEVGAVVVVILIAAVVGILLDTHKSSSSESNANSTGTLASDLAPSSTVAADSTTSSDPASAFVGDSALVSSTTGGNSLNIASTDIVSDGVVETASNGLASLDSPTSATGLSSGADLLGSSMSATDQMTGFASVTDVLGMSATSSPGGPASAATATSTALPPLNTLPTATTDALNRRVFDATNTAGDFSSSGLDMLSSLAIPTDVFTLDRMTTNGDGNLVFTFTASIDLDPAADSALTAAFSFGDHGAATRAGDTFTFSSAESAIATAPPAFFTSSASASVGAASTSTTSAAEASSTSSTASMSRVFNTTAIFYSETDWTGACGKEIKQDTYSIALPLALYQDVTSASPLCGETVVPDLVRRDRLNVTVLDASNRTEYAIFPLSVFKQLGGDEETGELQVQYRFWNGSALETAGLEGDEEGGGTGSEGGGDGGGTDEGKEVFVADPVELGVAHKATWTSLHKSSSSTSSSKSSKQTSSSSSGKTYSGGMATYYYQNNNAGACGDYNSNSAIIVALPSSTYANGKYCGKTLTITRTSSGKTLKAKVADECPTCENAASLDLSFGAYAALGGTEKEGQFEITWQFVD
ncbi:hypothetical protein JCM8097_003536 [Rhodosporidiobolus ruineniae]